jgi:hypothetical protein
MPKETQQGLSLTAESLKPQEFIPESLRLQQEIEESLVLSGRSSLQAWGFADQTRFWAEDNPEQRTKLLWEIWDNMVWTPGYGPAYADTKKQVRSWFTALVRDARSDYAREHGYGKMIRSRSEQGSHHQSGHHRYRCQAGGEGAQHPLQGAIQGTAL